MLMICRAIKRSNCFHRNGHDAACLASDTTNMIIFAGIQILLSQLPNFHKIWWLSIVAAVMSLAYSTIGLGLSIAKIAGKNIPSDIYIWMTKTNLCGYLILRIARNIFFLVLAAHRIETDSCENPTKFL